jgi:hypothetical protein
MRLKAKFRVPRFDLARYKAALHEKLSEALAQAGCKWLYTVEEIVPVWSGASRATLSPLASYVGYSLVISPVGGAPDRIDVGIAHGSATFEGDQERGRYSFSYTTTLPWLIVNEYYNANTFINPKTGQPYFHLRRPGPYHFQEAAARALQEYLTTELEGLPDVRKYITTTTVSMG